MPFQRVSAAEYLPATIPNTHLSSELHPTTDIGDTVLRRAVDMHSVADKLNSGVVAFVVPSQIGLAGRGELAAADGTLHGSQCGGGERDEWLGDLLHASGGGGERCRN